MANSKQPTALVVENQRVADLGKNVLKIFYYH